MLASSKLEKKKSSRITKTTTSREEMQIMIVEVYFVRQEKEEGIQVIW